MQSKSEKYDNEQVLLKQLKASPHLHLAGRVQPLPLSAAWPAPELPVPLFRSENFKLKKSVK